MVRVHQPPGGETKLTSDSSSPEHHTVRVLKPPGGGSSISFGEEEDYMKPQPKPTPAQQAPKEESNEQTPKVETNGMDTPQKDNVAATKENLSTTTNGSVNSGSSTPTHSKVDTQSRLFGEQQPREALGRKVRDHQRSNIFGTEEDVRANGTSNGSPRAAGNPVPDTPESKTPDQQQPQQKQRIPPGGFSTKLW